MNRYLNYSISYFQYNKEIKKSVFYLFLISNTCIYKLWWMLITLIVICTCVFLFLLFLRQQGVNSFFLHFYLFLLKSFAKNILLFCTPNPSSSSIYAMSAIPSNKKQLLQRYKDYFLKASKVTIDFTRILQRHVEKGLNIKTCH